MAKGTCNNCFHRPICIERRYYGTNQDTCGNYYPDVVLCKDCKHLACNSAIDRDFRCRNYPYGLRGTLNPIEENPFCSYGEKRGESK